MGKSHAAFGEYENPFPVYDVPASEKRSLAELCLGTCRTALRAVGGKKRHIRSICQGREDSISEIVAIREVGIYTERKYSTLLRIKEFCMRNTRVDQQNLSGKERDFFSV